MSQSPCRAPRFLRQILSSLVTTGFRSYMYSFLNFCNPCELKAQDSDSFKHPWYDHLRYTALDVSTKNPPTPCVRVELMGGSSMNQVKLILNH